MDTREEFSKMWVFKPNTDVWEGQGTSCPEENQGHGKHPARATGLCLECWKKTAGPGVWR